MYIIIIKGLIVFKNNTKYVGIDLRKLNSFSKNRVFILKNLINT